MVIRDQDPSTYQFKFRLENIALQERLLMGGSWARSAEYLRCGYVVDSFSVRHPDIGFRLLRSPEGVDWQLEPRKLIGISQGAGSVLLKWALLNSDSKSTAFNVYRLSGKDRHHAGFRVNQTPIRGTTCFLDTETRPGEWYQYYVRAVDGEGREGARSGWAGICPAEESSPVVTRFKPVSSGGDLVPVFGDLTGDQSMGCVIRLDNGVQEASQDPGVPVQLEAFTSYGRSLWRLDICDHAHCYGSASNVPFNVYDINGDGRAEVITRYQIGDDVFVAILDGMTGKLLHKAKWPEMVSDTQRSSTRIHLSVAYLDGKTPAIVTQTGLYENEVFVAFDSELNEIWRFNSFGATSGSGAHKIEIADVNGDGKHEVFDGTTCLNSDGTVRWSIYKMHPDVVSINKFLPDRAGLQVFYIVETGIHAGIYMVDADTGEMIWKANREDDPRWEHAHFGWTARIWDGSPGIQCLTNRGGHADQHMILYSADRRNLMRSVSIRRNARGLGWRKRAQAFIG